MEKSIYLKPAPMAGEDGQPIARVVPDPQQAFRPLAAEGEFKPLDAYWTRRLRDGDVVEIKAEPPPPAFPPAAAKTASRKN